ncbi:type II toxin-antitoxin system PemK/MazF family toxin [Sporomusa sphaeroides]|uniref:type II toxin-antitoxin system PemK/MazF family toxin n=1 Tax=Sporomusa sphaeroides TaxID=47679 RepID=UPI003A520A9A
MNLNPTKGREMNTVRPCVILSPTEANKHFLTVISATITNTDLGLPTRCKIKVGCLSGVEIQAINSTIKEYLVD